MGVLESLPPEIIKLIADLLEYGDGLSSKHTSRALYHLVDVPTIRSFQTEVRMRAPTRARSLKMLTEENIMSRDKAICQYCSLLLTKRSFDRWQATHIRANQNGLANFQALTDLFCVKCGVKKRRYKPSATIERFHLDESRATICYACRSVRPIRESCPACKACHCCCRVANIVANKGGIILCEVKNLAIYHHVALLHSLAPHESAELRSRHFRCRLTSLPFIVQHNIFNRLDYSSAMAIKHSCHRFFKTLAVSAGEPAKLRPFQWICSCTVFPGDFAWNYGRREAATTTRKK